MERVAGFMLKRKCEQSWPMGLGQWYNHLKCDMFPKSTTRLRIDHDVNQSAQELSLPSGKRLHNHGKSPFLMGKSTIFMVIFNSKLLVFYQAGYILSLGKGHDARCWVPVWVSKNGGTPETGIVWSPQQKDLKVELFTVIGSQTYPIRREYQL